MSNSFECHCISCDVADRAVKMTVGERTFICQPPGWFAASAFTVLCNECSREHTKGSSRPPPNAVVGVDE